MISAWWLLLAAGVGAGAGMFLFALMSMAGEQDARALDESPLPQHSTAS